MITLEDNESIVLVARKHFFFLFLEMIPLLPVILLPVIGFVVLGPTNLSGYLFFFLSIWLFLVWIGGFFIWTDYYLDTLVLTNKKIVDIEQRGLFSREISSLRLERIQDVTISIPGLIATFFKFGNIRIQTAGETQEIVIRYMRAPEQVKEAIMREYAKAMEELKEVRIIS